LQRQYVFYLLCGNLAVFIIWALTCTFFKSQAFDEAIAELDTLSEESYKDSTANNAITERQLDIMDLGHWRKQSRSRRRGKLTGLPNLSASF
jgi:hypothetical protein